MSPARTTKTGRTTIAHKLMPNLVPVDDLGDKGDNCKAYYTRVKRSAKI